MFSFVFTWGLNQTGVTSERGRARGHEPRFLEFPAAKCKFSFSFFGRGGGSDSLKVMPMPRLSHGHWAFEIWDLDSKNASDPQEG